MDGCAEQLTTPDGHTVEVVDPGVHNLQAGPDFFNAKVRIDGTLWAGNVEIHTRSSDWFRHHHETDAAYNNVILHVVAVNDSEVVTAGGKQPPQVIIGVPPAIEANYRELLAEETYPPCYRIIPHVPAITVRSWLSRLTVERLETKTQRVNSYLQRTDGDWERAFFITLARNFGFGTNAEPFEHWAFRIEPSAVGKHRDDLFKWKLSSWDRQDCFPTNWCAPNVATIISADYKRNTLSCATNSSSSHWRRKCGNSDG